MIELLGRPPRYRAFAVTKDAKIGTIHTEVGFVRKREVGLPCSDKPARIEWDALDVGGNILAYGLKTRKQAIACLDRRGTA